MEVAFSLDAFEASRLPVLGRFISLPLGVDAMPDWAGRTEDGVIEFRLPTGADQESLAELACQNNPRAVNLLLARCVRRVGSVTEVDEAVIERLPAPVRDEIENRMQAMAPRMTIDLEGVCPECRSSYAIPFDGTSFFVAEMRGDPRRLLRDVHLLAWHYHWSESEILLLPTTKRLNYIRYLEKQIEAQDHA